MEAAGSSGTGEGCREGGEMSTSPGTNSERGSKQPSLLFTPEFDPRAVSEWFSATAPLFKIFCKSRGNNTPIVSALRSLQIMASGNLPGLSEADFAALE